LWLNSNQHHFPIRNVDFLLLLIALLLNFNQHYSPIQNVEKTNFTQNMF